MAITRPKPRNFDIADLEQVTKQTLVQEISNTVQRSTDPENFPVFEILPGEKVLAYVPNHTVLDENEEVVLRMDAPYIHTLHPNEKTWIKTRCTRNINHEALGLDGNCPFCDVVGTSFDLANAEIAHNVGGLPGSPSPDDKSNEQVKAIRSSAFRNRPVDQPNRYYTFPIIIIDTDLNSKGRPVPRPNENGEIGYRKFWYNVSERMYAKTWATVFENADEDVDMNSLGGHLYVLSYGSEENGQKPSKMNAARDFMPRLRQLPEKMQEVAKKWDKETLDWTPAKAIQTVIDNQFPDMEWAHETAAELEQEMKKRINLFSASDASVPENQGTGSVSLDALKGGGTSAKGLLGESEGSGQNDGTPAVEGTSED